MFMAEIAKHFKGDLVNYTDPLKKPISIFHWLSNKLAASPTD